MRTTRKYYYPQEERRSLLKDHKYWFDEHFDDMSDAALFLLEAILSQIKKDGYRCPDTGIAVDFETELSAFMAYRSFGLEAFKDVILCGAPIARDEEHVTLLMSFWSDLTLHGTRLFFNTARRGDCEMMRFFVDAILSEIKRTKGERRRKGHLVTIETGEPYMYRLKWVRD